jgi:hypothetical protein
MPIDIETQSPTSKSTAAERPAYRFHAPHLHLQSVFGDDWFALKAEAFARFFGTPRFLIAQTVIGYAKIEIRLWCGDRCRSRAAPLTPNRVFPGCSLDFEQTGRRDL